MDIRFAMADKDGRPICPEQFFGRRDARRIDKSIHLIFASAVARLYDGCYKAPCMGLIEYMKAHGSADGYMDYRKSWYNAHLDEREKELKSRKQRDEELKRAFRTVYGIAKGKGNYLAWDGKGNPCEPDRWRVFKNNALVAYIQM